MSFVCKKSDNVNFSAVFSLFDFYGGHPFFFPLFSLFDLSRMKISFFSSSPPLFFPTYVQNSRRRKCRLSSPPCSLYKKVHLHFTLRRRIWQHNVTEFKKMFHLSFGEIGTYTYIPAMAEGGNILNRISLNHDTLPLVFTFRVRYRVIKGKGKC